MTVSSSKRDDADKAIEGDHTATTRTRRQKMIIQQASHEYSILLEPRNPRLAQPSLKTRNSRRSTTRLPKVSRTWNGMKNMKRQATDRTAVTEGGLRAVGTKKLETVLKKRKEKQEDAMIDFIVETQNKNLDPDS
jgi:hypothetical protein